MRNGKSPGEDRITPEMLQMGGKALIETICVLLNTCLMGGKIPDSWKNAEVVLIYKKGVHTNIENYIDQ